MRKNQHDFVSFSEVKSKIRKRIETNLSQLHGQFLWTVNHVKTFLGLDTRLFSKITAFNYDSILEFLGLSQTYQ